MTALFDKLPASPMSEAQRVAIPVEDLNAIAHSIAYEAATGDVESLCVYIGESEGCSDWWELDFSLNEDGSRLANSVRYLDARGLLERHPQMPNWVALIDESEATR